MPHHWDRSLVLGLDEIDTQHRNILERLDRLSEAARNGESHDVLREMVGLFFDYTHVHFSAEDRLMVAYHYPQIAELRREHRQFNRDAGQVRKRIEQAGGAMGEVAMEGSARLRRWIIEHIRYHDQEMAAYVKERMALGQRHKS